AQLPAADDRRKVGRAFGRTIVLGGLIRDNKGDGKQGIPWLQDIPVIGALFSTTTLSKTRTELLVMITPRVVRTEQDVREVGSELKSKMQGLKPLLGIKR
ncbi:type II secretion system protein GspD, partial [Zoogloea sp.]|uniref:type II secretion system protein GspD n=1 Tax=Zoogloea sp. TaxID=49181 RepID=UPI00345B7D28